MGLKIFLVLFLSAVFLNCNSRNNKTNDQDLASYIRSQVADGEKWQPGDQFPDFVNNPKYNYYNHGLPIEDGGLIFVNVLRKVNNRKLFLAIITGCDQRFDIILSRVLERPYSDESNLYFNYFISLTQRDVAALLYAEKFTSDQLVKDISAIKELNCTGQAKFNIESYKHKKNYLKATILMVAARKEDEGSNIFDYTTVRPQEPKGTYDSIKLLIKESFLKNLEKHEKRDTLFSILETRLMQAEFNEPIFWQYEGPYIEDHGNNKGFMKVIFDDFRAQKAVPYFKYYDNAFGFVGLVHIEKEF